MLNASGYVICDLYAPSTSRSYVNNSVRGTVYVSGLCPSVADGAKLGLKVLKCLIRIIKPTNGL